MTLVDTNVLLDITSADPVWLDWSRHALRSAALAGPLVINPVIFAELSVPYPRIEDVDHLIATLALTIEEVPHNALFLAGKAFAQYRGRGGARTGVLSDFFIGAHAAVAGQLLLTRDVARYRTYFPTVALICPDRG